MSSANISLNIKGFEGSNANSCSNLNFLKNVNLSSINVEEYKTETIELAASASVTLFSVLTADAKKIVYIQASGECGVEINGVVQESIKPIVIGAAVKDGIYLKSGSFEEIVLTNNGVDAIIISYIALK
jgi:hypothetical protein